MNIERVERGPSRLTRLGPGLGVFVAVLLAVPALDAPLLQDDVAHRAMLDGKLPGMTWGPLELYDFLGGPTRPTTLLRESGFVPWFAQEDLKLRFFRPLSSAVLAVDWRLFGERTWASRVHTLAWFLAIVVMTAALHRRALPPATAGLATLIYAIAEAHAVPIAWIAARHTLIATTFALASVCLHVRARQDVWKPGRWLSPLALAVGLLAGEVAVGGVALIASWELFGRRDALAVRMRALAPAGMVAAAHLVFYVTAGYGVRGGAAYIGPDSGVAGALAALRHFLISVGDLVSATPADAFSTAAADVQTVAALWGVLVAVAAWLLFRTLAPHLDPRERHALRWLPLAAAAAALPGAPGVPGGRVLTLALVPASGAVAALLIAGASALRRKQIHGLRRAFVSIAIAALALGHLAIAPLFRLLVGVSLSQLAVVQHRLAATTPACGGTMVMVAVSDPAVAVYVPATMVLHDRGPERLRVLSMAPADHRIENVTATGFDLVTLLEARRWSFWEQLYRREPLPAGTHVATDSLDIRVLEDRRGIPVRVRFDFGEPLASSNLCFYQWHDRRISPLPPPRRGDVLYLPHEPGPMGM